MNYLVRKGEFRPSPLLEEHEQEGGHHGAQAQARHGRGRRELREAVRAGSSRQAGSHSRKKKNKPREMLVPHSGLGPVQDVHEEFQLGDVV